MEGWERISILKSPISYLGGPRKIWENSDCSTNQSQTQALRDSIKLRKIRTGY